MKRRRLDLGDLMVKTTGPAKPISDKPTTRDNSVSRERPYTTTSGKQRYGTGIHSSLTLYRPEKPRRPYEKNLRRSVTATTPSVGRNDAKNASLQRRS